ncbi:hypothetical protein AAFF_G00300390 [Aldrovandia affinis]|uniref:Pleckstrin homology domain-containing family A member 7 n=1 Tax=Aldrovandia affinis TaxID=143900 RepID=A0AAD7SPY0_9TELE|nr:hypothetical protein AAFF_G00300390 [Aldrovandia affinis]
MAAPLGRDTLPDHWSYGVCKDGRVFFINDESCSTTWLHPRTGEPVNSGHMIRSDLPRGWEEGFTDEGASYFINHNQRTTAFRHPVTAQISPENIDFVLREQPNSCMSQPRPEPRPPSMVSESSTAVTSSTVDPGPGSKASRTGGKMHSFGKRDQAIKRNRNVPVVVRGWLYKQDSSGMRLWKRKWFVLSDYCLFYYKDSREEAILGSIPLPSYAIAPVEPDDHISRKYAFKCLWIGNPDQLLSHQASHTGMRSYIYSKSSVIGSQAEHSGMRTYFFSADTQEDMKGWVRAMNQAALMQNHSTKRESEKLERSERQVVLQTNHVNSNGESPTRRRRGAGERPAARPQGSNGNGNGSAAPVEQNGNAVYKRGLAPHTDTERQVQRKTALAQVQHWVKVQKGEPRSLPLSEHTLPRRTPPLQPRARAAEAYQSLPKTSRLSSGGSSPQAPRNLPSDYKYAQDRLSHFRMSLGERSANREGTVWQLYEWQQRQQFRHGSPTAPVYTPAPDYQDPASFRAPLDVPRCVSVPPFPSDVPPGKALSPRRPHTPADRVSVRPPDEKLLAEVPASTPPPRAHTAPRWLSAPSLHGKTPEELTLLLVQLRRHQAKMADTRHGVLAHLQQHNGPSGPRLQADDTYMQLKKDLEYLDLKASPPIRKCCQECPLVVPSANSSSKAKAKASPLGLQMKSIEPLIIMVHSVLQNSAQGCQAALNVTGRETLKDRSAKPVKIAESDVDVKLSRLCEQDKILQELETRMRTLKEDKDKLESVLDVSHQQMEQYWDQPAHTQKIAYQQRLLQEDVVHIRAEISRVSTEMENAWNEYGRLETDLDQLSGALLDQMNRNILSQQEKEQMRRELWRVEDVLAGLSSSKANYEVTIESVKNPERKLVPSASSTVPSQRASMPAGETDPTLCPAQPANDSKQPLQPLAQAPHGSALNRPGPKWAEEGAPPPAPPAPGVQP